MKKLVIAACFAVSVLVANGQGRVRFANNSLTLISTNAIVGGPATGTTAGPVGAYYYGLFFAPVGTTDPSAFTFTEAYATNTTSTGRLNGGDAEVPGSTGANSFAILVRGWSANIGHDWPVVASYLQSPSFDGWYGESSIGNAQPIPPEGPYPNVFGAAPGAVNGFTLQLYSAPEPTAASLIILTAVAPLFRHRRG